MSSNTRTTGPLPKVDSETALRQALQNVLAKLSLNPDMPIQSSKQQGKAYYIHGFLKKTLQFLNERAAYDVTGTATGRGLVKEDKEDLITRLSVARQFCENLEQMGLSATDQTARDQEMSVGEARALRDGDVGEPVREALNEAVLAGMELLKS